jgi:hypothetical protein
VQCVGVDIRVDADSVNTEPPRRASHPAGDLASVGNQDAFEQYL